MKSLKIIVAVILVLGLVLAFSACGKKDTVKEGVLTGNQRAVPAMNTTKATRLWASTLKSSR